MSLADPPAPSPAPAPGSSLALLVWSADLDTAQRAATPFVMAQAAVALDMRVEMYFTARTVRLLLPASAGHEIGFGQDRLPLGEHLRRVREAGVTLLACSQALHAEGLTREQLHPACTGLGGAVQFMARCADPAWRTLVF